MPYVRRDKDKQIDAVCGIAQPGHAEEYLGDDNAELIAYLATQNPPKKLYCSPLQARLALYQAGLLEDVKTFVGTLSEPEKLTWEYATVIHESNEIVQKAAEALSLSKEQVTELFEAAKEF